jgi:hypothetical protein
MHALGLFRILMSARLAVGENAKIKMQVASWHSLPAGVLSAIRAAGVGPDKSRRLTIVPPSPNQSTAIRARRGGQPIRRQDLISAVPIHQHRISQYLAAGTSLSIRQHLIMKSAIRMPLQQFLRRKHVINILVIAVRVRFSVIQ